MKNRFSETRIGKFDDGLLKGRFGMKKGWFSKVVLIQVLLVSLFWLVSGAFAGANESFEKLKQQNIERALKYKRLKDTEVPSTIRKFKRPLEQVLPVDKDDDGMADSWEQANGLDSNDPNDAWLDPDGDEVVNLFEYQLDSDLNNPATPPIATVPGDFPDVAIAINAISPGTVIRVAGGSYPVNYMTFTSKVVMIQGGWSSDFSERDLSRYPTTFDGGMQEEILYFSVDSGEPVIILDGLHFVRGRGGFGAVNLLAKGSTFMRTSVFNCYITKSDVHCDFYSYGGVLRLNNWDTSVSDRTIANTLIADNTASGIKSQVTDDTTAHWRIINTTISGNRDGGEDDGYGIDTFTLDNGMLTAHIYNSIIRGNEQDDLDIRGDITFKLDYSNIGNKRANKGATFLSGAKVVDIEPLFVDGYHLQPDSPCIDAGTPDGAPLADIEGNPRNELPDMGAYECGKSTFEPPIITGIEPFSGPTNGGTAVTITGKNFTNGVTVKIGVRDAVDVKVVSATEITATTPPGSEGTADVIVTNPDGKSVTLKNGFTYNHIGPVPILSITSSEALPGYSITIQIAITDATGIAAGEILVKYDPDIITVGEIKGTDLIANLTHVVNKNVLGEIKVVMAGVQGIQSGSGALIEIEFTVSEDATISTETTVELAAAELYDEDGKSISINLENGVAKIQNVIKGDVNNDGKVRPNDALIALQIVAALIEPNDHQKWAADMDGDGNITVKDALLILRKADGLAAPGIQPIITSSGTITVILPETDGIAGESVTVPLKVDSIDGLAGGDICLVYDSKVLRPVDVSSNANLLLASNITDGIVRITFASADRLKSNTVAEIRFDILSDGGSPLTLQKVELYQPDATLVDSRRIDGQFSSFRISPKRNELLPNFPNPFNPETWIPFKLADDSSVAIRIYNAKGQIIRTISLGQKSAGVYTTQNKAAYWDGRDSFGEKVASGIYYYTLQAGEFKATRKMMILK